MSHFTWAPALDTHRTDAAKAAASAARADFGRRMDPPSHGWTRSTRTPCLRAARTTAERANGGRARYGPPPAVSTIRARAARRERRLPPRVGVPQYRARLPDDERRGLPPACFGRDSWDPGRIARTLTRQFGKERKLMKLSTSARLITAALAAAALASCAASTQLTSSWADPAAAGRSYKKIVVVGVTNKAPIRREYEDAFSRELAARGVTATPSYNFGGPDNKLDKDAAIAKLQEIGADAVLVTRLVDKEQYQTYYPPSYSTVAAPSPYYGGWYGYYSMGYSYMTSPGYVEENQVYRIETILYDVNGDKLIWSGLTETTLISGDAPDAEIAPMIAALSYDMEKHKVLPPYEKKKK